MLNFMKQTQNFSHATALHLRESLETMDGAEVVCSIHHYREDDKFVRTVEEIQDPRMMEERSLCQLRLGQRMILTFGELIIGVPVTTCLTR